MQFSITTLFLVSMLSFAIAAPMPAPVAEAKAIAANLPPRQITPSGSKFFSSYEVFHNIIMEF